MADLSIRNLDEKVKERLHVRAAHHGRSMEAEIRAILTESVKEADRPEGLMTALLHRFQEVGGVELDLPARSTPVRAADLST